ncbi:hypothetical protein [Marinobacter alexandrii]|uniref:hypothetical protein n=1 Tax=Marinobacter alexandrii TaxID=2570351 RepID=UPI0011083614|nr:hypothetical protein [Marinobacter alexandrii]
MNKLKLPVKFDEDFDIVDAEGFPLLFGADMIDHHPEIGQEIMKRVNSHGPLVECLRQIQSDISETGNMRDETYHFMHMTIRELEQS